MVTDFTLQQTERFKLVFLLFFSYFCSKKNPFSSHNTTIKALHGSCLRLRR